MQHRALQSYQAFHQHLYLPSLLDIALKLELILHQQNLLLLQFLYNLFVLNRHILILYLVMLLEMPYLQLRIYDN